MHYDRVARFDPLSLGIQFGCPSPGIESDGLIIVACSIQCNEHILYQCLETNSSTVRFTEEYFSYHKPVFIIFGPSFENSVHALILRLLLFYFAKLNLWIGQKLQYDLESNLEPRRTLVAREKKGGRLPYALSDSVPLKPNRRPWPS